jgi:hypothetical protein
MMLIRFVVENDFLPSAEISLRSAFKTRPLEGGGGMDDGRKISHFAIDPTFRKFPNDSEFLRKSSKQIQSFSKTSP